MLPENYHSSQENLWNMKEKGAMSNTGRKLITYRDWEKKN